MKSARITVLLGAAVVAAACGQKGPLVLPDRHAQPPTNGAAPAAASSAMPTAPTDGMTEPPPAAAPPQ